MSLISLLLVVSFVLIPVRCDASTAPHSIFVSPNMLNPSAGHEHHMSGAATQSEQTKSIPHHSPVAADADPAMAAMQVVALVEERAKVEIQAIAVVPE